MDNIVKRAWINQPSSAQPLHKLHGTNVLAVYEGYDTWRVYFLNGETISMEVSELSISDGWI